jgi:hypothetical protein
MHAPRSISITTGRAIASDAGIWHYTADHHMMRFGSGSGKHAAAGM